MNKMDNGLGSLFYGSLVFSSILCIYFFLTGQDIPAKFIFSMIFIVFGFIMLFVEIREWSGWTVSDFGTLGRILFVFTFGLFCLAIMVTGAEKEMTLSLILNFLLFFIIFVLGFIFTIYYMCNLKRYNDKDKPIVSEDEIIQDLHHEFVSDFSDSEDISIRELTATIKAIGVINENERINKITKKPSILLFVLGLILIGISIYKLVPIIIYFVK